MQKALILFSFILASCAGIQTRYHEVKAGDTLGRVAEQYNVPVRELARANSNQAAKGLKVGSKLYIPFEEGIDWDKDVENEIALESPTLKSQPAVTVPFSWPMKGWISSKFGKRRRKMHDGIDIAAPHGTPIAAARSGHVIYAGARIPGYGKMVIVRHADEYSSVYAHLSRINVKKGQFVARGQRLGRCGQTGRATGPHLHFEVRENRVPVNPLLYLQGQYATNKIRSR